MGTRVSPVFPANPPFPSCPRSFAPQQNSAPSVRTAHVCVAPALICVHPRLPGTFVSVGPVKAKSPTCPLSFEPQQKASRTTVIAQVCLDPALIALNLAVG